MVIIIEQFLYTGSALYVKGLKAFDNVHSEIYLLGRKLLGMIEPSLAF